MKTIDEFYKIAKGDKAVRREFSQAVREGKVDAFLKAHDCGATSKEALAYLRSVESGALADDDLESVAGGCGTTNSCNPDSCYTMHCAPPVS